MNTTSPAADVTATTHASTTLHHSADPLASYAPEIVHIPLADASFTATNIADFDTDESVNDELARLAAERDAMLAEAALKMPHADLVVAGR